MFIKIESNNVFCSEGDDSLIKKIEQEYFINTNSLIQVEFSDCLISNTFLNKVVKFEQLIKLYVLVEDGIWNFMTLYFTKKSHNQFQRIKKLIQTRE